MVNQILLCILENKVTQPRKKCLFLDTHFYTTRPLLHAGQLSYGMLVKRWKKQISLFCLLHAVDKTSERERREKMEEGGQKRENE